MSWPSMRTCLLLLLSIYVICIHVQNVGNHRFGVAVSRKVSSYHSSSTIYTLLKRSEHVSKSSLNLVTTRAWNDVLTPQIPQTFLPARARTSYRSSCDNNTARMLSMVLHSWWKFWTRYLHACSFQRGSCNLQARAGVSRLLEQYFKVCCKDWESNHGLLIEP